MALLLRCLVLAFVLPACAGAGQTRKKLGISGATCTASSDCEADLQCVRAVCTTWTSARPHDAFEAALKDLEAAEAAIEELEAAEAASARECAELDARRAAELEELVREFKALQAEQDRIRAKKDELERELKALTEEIERYKAADHPARAAKSAPRR